MLVPIFVCELHVRVQRALVIASNAELTDLLKNFLLLIGKRGGDLFKSIEALYNFVVLSLFCPSEALFVARGRNFA